MQHPRILFVCTGNICRSPTAACVFARLLEESGQQGHEIGSAGTGDWHVGQGADRRSAQHASRRGYDLSAHRARQVTKADFERFDLVLAMDRGHQRELEALAPLDKRHKIKLFMDYAGEPGTRDVPDPYYGGAEGFEKALDLIERAARGLLAELSGSEHRSSGSAPTAR